MTTYNHNRRFRAMTTTRTTHDALRTVRITTEQAKAATMAIAQVIAATDYEDCNTWHDGLGTDLCCFCEALVILRHAAGYEPVDHLRP